MSQAIADQLFLAYMGRAADTQWRSNTATLVTAQNGQPSAALQQAFYTQAVAEGVFSASDSPSVLVNKIFLQTFGFAASTFEQTAWGNLISNGTITPATAAWTIFASYLGATNVPAAYQLPVQSKLVAMNAFSNALTDPTVNAAYSQVNSASATAGRTWLNGVTSQATAATSITGVAATVAGLSVANGQTFTLTTSVDTYTGTISNDTINGLYGTGATLTALDSIDGGAGTDTLNLSDLAGTTAFPAGLKVKNVEIVNIVSAGAAGVADVSGWTNVTNLNVTSIAGAPTLTAGAAVTVKVTDSAQAAGNIGIDGGTAVTVASTGQTTGTIDIGATTAALGAVVVNNQIFGAVTGGKITVNGGTTVNVTQTNGNAAGATAITAESAVVVNGKAGTTTVTVTQDAVQTSLTAVAAVAATVAVNAVTAAPGTTGVKAVTAVSLVAAQTARAGVTANGKVDILDVNYNTTTANTISTVTLNNYGVSTIKGNALTSLTLSGTAGTLAITNATNGAGGVATTNATLALTLNKLSGTNTITDTNNEITTLNVTTTGGASKLAAFTDTGLKTLTVAGDQVLTLSAINGSLTSIAVSGAAGFNDGGTTAANGFAARGAAATLTTTSSGAITASVDATTQTFVGSTGKNTITIAATANATKVVTGGSGTTDELVLEGGAFALTSATASKVTGFETLGVAANVTGTVLMDTIGSGITALHVIGNSSVVFGKVAAATTSLTLDIAQTTTTVALLAANGAASALTVNLGGATSDTVNFGTVVLQDANGVGIGTVNLVSNGVNITAGDGIPNTNTMVLTDNGMSTLNFSGSQGLTLTTMDQASTQATAITINNTNSSAFGLLASTLVDVNLGSLTFTGTGKSVITLLTDTTSTTLGITNTGTQTAEITGIATSGNMTSLTLTGNVQIGTGLVASATGVLLTATTGLTISGATDHAGVRIIATGAASGVTDNITLGNGNNSITTTSSATTAIVNITVGTGSNNIAVGNGAQALDSTFNITLGAHTATTGINNIVINNTAGANFATLANNVITGAVTGDKVTFTHSLGILNGGAGTAALTAVTAGASVALTITALAAANGANAIAYSVFNGDTYVATSISGTEAAADVAIVKIVGVHTLSFTNDAGGGAADFITLLS